MKYVEISKLTSGMVIAESVMNQDGTIELLSKNSVLNERHINLLRKLGVLSVKIDDGTISKKAVAPQTPSLQADTIEKAALDANKSFDVESFKTELEELDNIRYKDVELKSVVNKKMNISVLTGEGNIPIDKRHEEMIKDTKKVFESLKDGDSVDYDLVRKNVEEALPDMIRNNDVLMRLNQLKETDDYTFEHSFRVSILAVMIGKWINYTKRELEELASAALMFDIGKMKIPNFILQKEGITEDEFEVIKRHSQFGYSVLMKTKGITSNIKYSALQHHERIDGSGYPLRLKEGQIHEFAKIIMICDIFDAMTHDRPYKNKVSPFKAAEYISWQSGVTLDSRLCYVFLTNLAEFYTGKDVVLSNGQRGRIIFVDVNFPTRPIIKSGDEIVDLIRNKEIEVMELIS
ncbi:HD-GYP domain-containing protein [Helicovermis profundi]|uniref:HD-GYP domain-containing protein n=1 Tax=Helicovermis profundi TaxID=3065157 RepID=A0AAU9E818_9FIRM|nr:hypothetical protein HLPR_02130 [Clostridia bacterium S502]